MLLRKVIETVWYPGDRLLITQITGAINAADLHMWQGSLENALDLVEDNGDFTVFVNLHGYQAVNVDVHKKFLDIIPHALAKYSWGVGYPDTFTAVTLENISGIGCLVAVSMHADEAGMPHLTNQL